MKKTVFRAVCLRDTVQDVPYMYYKAGVEYVISANSPVAVHFKPLEDLDDGKEDPKEAEVKDAKKK